MTLEKVIQSFPRRFGLRNFPGLKFRISTEKSYASDTGFHLVVQVVGGKRTATDAIKTPWIDFTRAAPDDLRKAVVELPGTVKREGLGDVYPTAHEVWTNYKKGE